MLNYVPGGGHVGWVADMTGAIFEGDHPRTIVNKFGSNRRSSFREEDFFKYFP